MTSSSPHTARRRRIRRLARAGLASLIATTALAAIAPAAQAAPDRPRITGFYVRDEGVQIQLKVNWCVPGYAVGHSIISTFRMWDPDGYLLVNRRISGRATQRCMSDSLKLNDVYPYGLYSANVAVTDRTAGGFIRLRARSFWIN